MVMETETPFRANVGAMGSQKYEAVDPVDLQAGPSRAHNYPPDYSHMSIPLSNLSPLSSRANTLRPDPALRYDPERAPGMPTASGSWKKIEHSYQEFDPARDATEAHLAFADGDIPNNQACSFRRTSSLNNHITEGVEAIQLSPQCLNCKDHDIF
jgi:hypothetical protein